MIRALHRATSPSPETWRGLCQHFIKTFSDASAQRAQRNEFVPDPDHGYEALGWVLFERDTMHAEVNRLRAERGKAPASRESLLQVEQSASGHSDYWKQFAIGCAGLVERG